MHGRIEFTLLDADEDMALYDGEPFSGIAYSLYLNGRLRSEHPFRNGFEEGLCRDWHENGQLAAKWSAARGQATRLLEWFESGIVKCAGRYEYGVELAYKEWNDQGDLIVERVIAADSPLHKYIERRRKEGW